MTDEHTYTYWFIYLVPDDLLERYISEVSLTIPKLYGYTDDKELLKMWKSQRKKELFYITKKKLSKEELNVLAERMQTGKLMLASGVTRTPEEFRLYELAVTVREYNRTYTENAFNVATLAPRIGKNLFPAEVYTPFLRSILQIVCYDTILHPGSDYDRSDYDTLSDYDFFKQFIHNYQELLA